MEITGTLQKSSVGDRFLKETNEVQISFFIFLNQLFLNHFFLYDGAKNRLP